MACCNSLSVTVGTPKNRVLPFPLGISTPRMGCGRYSIPLMDEYSVVLLCRICSVSSVTLILPTPALPLFAITCFKARCMQWGCNTLSIITNSFNLFRFPKANPEELPLWIKNQNTFSPSCTCETFQPFVHFQLARYCVVLWPLLTSWRIETESIPRPPLVRALYSLSIYFQRCSWFASLNSFIQSPIHLHKENHPSVHQCSITDFGRRIGVDTHPFLCASYVLPVRRYRILQSRPCTNAWSSKAMLFLLQF